MNGTNKQAELNQHWKQNFDYKYTGAYELEQGQTVQRKIKSLSHEEVDSDRGKQNCFVAYFEGQTKPMVLNKTNCKTLEKLYGSQPKNWIGKDIILYATKVRAFGEYVEALRIKDIKPVSKSLDVTKEIELLKKASNLEELAAIYQSFSSEIKHATLTIKDELKLKFQQK